ncbi:MAG: flagellar basal body-associated FliL family protein [Terriglobales bacterium]
MAEKSTLPLETFVVNLSGGGQRAYLRLGVTLGLAHVLPRNREEVAVPLVRDAILSVLANAKADELLTTQGKEQLKADLLRSITHRAPELGVESVFFTEFLVQM